MIEALPALKGLLDYFARQRRRRTVQGDQALATLYAAACETKIYLEKLERTKRRNRRTEAQLSRLWAQAAVSVRHLDRELAGRLLLKSDLWASPQRWTKEGVTRNRIGIGQVWEDARKLLLG